MKRFRLEDGIEQYRRLYLETADTNPEVSKNAKQVWDWLCELRRYRRGTELKFPSQEAREE